MDTGIERELKRHVRSWRDAMERRTAFRPADLDELESHLWEEIDRLIATGASPREAVLGASARIGHADVLASEFKKTIVWSDTDRTRWHHLTWRFVMWKNHILVALRTLRKQGVYSAINIGGLGLGLACAFLIFLFVRHEMTYDRFHETGDRLYRMYIEQTTGQFAGNKRANFPAGMAEQLASRGAGIAYTVLYDVRTPYLGVGDRSQRVGTVGFMSPEGMDAFTFPMAQGDPRQALSDPHSIVLSQEAAALLFGTQDPMGQRVVWGDVTELTVTGVFRALPTKTHLQFKALVPVELMNDVMGPGAMTNFSNWNYNLYAVLEPGVDPDAVSASLRPYVVELNDGDEASADEMIFRFQPVSGIHLDPSVTNGKTRTTDPDTIWMFLGVGLLILVIAGVNFTNMATAQALQRAREVGVRKTVGAVQGQLTAQFLLESCVVGLLGTALGLGLAVVALPSFANLVGTDLGSGIDDPLALMMLLGAGLLTGAVAGLYPAVFLASFRPSQVLKGKLAAHGGSGRIRKGLIVFQFSISIFLIVATLGVYNQLSYMRSMSLGFDKEQIIFAPINDPLRENFEIVRQDVLQHARIMSASLAGNLPGRVGTSRGYFWPGQDADDENNRSFTTVLADYDYLQTLGLELIAGRDFSRERPTDFEDAYILNETAARLIGYTEPADAVDAPFRAWDKEMGTIIGVVKDFHFQSLHESIEPVVINIKPWISYAAFRVSPGDAGEVVDILTAAWARYAPGYPIDYRFLDEDFDRLYEKDRQLGSLFTFFTILAIGVSCLGLFGLSAYSARRRTKEIGVRKVLGAEVKDIVLLLSKEFTILVALAFLVAAPVAWFAMDRYLADFAYRTSVSPLLVLSAGAAAFVIAWSTVGWQAFRASRVNPVVSLKVE